MNILISAGDPSGDIHAANLVKALKKADRNVSITALGGQQLSHVSDKFVYNLVNLGGFGFWQPVNLYFKLKKVLVDIVIRFYSEHKPDKVIVVDYYGFNIHVAREAFKRGIPVYYYISPQVWASRPGRIRKIAKYVKKMLVILPFEEELYKKSGVDTVFVGHPLIDAVMAPPEIVETVNNKITIGLFPGSRPNVFKRHIGLLMETAEKIKASMPQILKYFASRSLPKTVEAPYPVVVEDSYSERKDITLAITTSGTVSLENALLGIPMIVYYKLSKFNYFIAKMLVKIPYITMVNILLNRMLVPEFIQDDATGETISQKALSLLKDSASLKSYRNELLALRKVLGENGVSDRAAAIILK